MQLINIFTSQRLSTFPLTKVINIFISPISKQSITIFTIPLIHQSLNFFIIIILSPLATGWRGSCGGGSTAAEAAAIPKKKGGEGRRPKGRRTDQLSISGDLDKGDSSGSKLFTAQLSFPYSNTLFYEREIGRHFFCTIIILCP